LGLGGSCLSVAAVAVAYSFSFSLKLSSSTVGTYKEARMTAKVGFRFVSKHALVAIAILAAAIGPVSAVNPPA